MKRIIIIDDDPAILDVFELVFKRAGFAVTALEGGEQLLGGSFEEPDIFLIDKQLQGIDGLDICRFLKKRKHLGQTPVLIFSASPRVEQRAKEAGADGFLEKPIKIKYLLENIQKHINPLEHQK